MSTSIKIKVLRDDVTPAAKGLRDAVGSEIMGQAMGAAMMEVVRSHFRNRSFEPNQMGAPKTGFWEKIGNGTSYYSTGATATVTIPAPFAQKLYGGTILPGPGRKALAFPISPLSYGRTAAEMRQEGKTRYVPVRGSNVIGIIVSSESNRVIGNALFLVVRKVTQAADPNALPSEESIVQAARDMIETNLEPFLN